MCGSEVTSACRRLAGGGPSSPTSRTVRFTAWGVCAGGGRSHAGPPPAPGRPCPGGVPGWGPHAHARGAHTALKPVPLTCTGRGVAASVTRPDATRSHTCAECTPHCQPPPVTETDLTPERGREPSLPAAGPPGAGRRSPWPGEGVVAAFAQDFLALGFGLGGAGTGRAGCAWLRASPVPSPPAQLRMSGVRTLLADAGSSHPGAVTAQPVLQPLRWRRPQPPSTPCRPRTPTAVPGRADTGVAGPVPFGRNQRAQPTAGAARLV